MPIPEGHQGVTAIVPDALHDALQAIAHAEHTSVSKILSEWITSGAGDPLLVSGKPQKVRAYKDELMVSLPQSFRRATGLRKKDTVMVSHSLNALIIRA